MKIQNLFEEGGPIIATCVYTQFQICCHSQVSKLQTKSEVLYFLKPFLNQIC